MLKQTHARLVQQTQAFVEACQRGARPDTRLRHKLLAAARLRPEAAEADVALRQACANLTSDIGQSLMGLESWTAAEPLAQACVTVRERLAGVALALAQPRRSAAIWTLTLMPRDAEDQPQAALATTVGWTETRAQAEQWLHGHGTLQHYYCFAVIEQVRPAPLGTIPSTVRWYRARWDLAQETVGDPQLEPIDPPPGFENCGAFGL